MTDNIVSIYNLSVINNKQFLLHNITVNLKKDISFIVHSNIQSILSKIELLIPEYLLVNLNTINIDKHSYYDHNNQAKTYFTKDEFCISSDIFSLDDMYTNFLFGLLKYIAYSFYSSIFKDGCIEKEYVNKKLDLYKSFNKKLLNIHKITVEDFIDTKYNENAINFLFKKIKKDFRENMILKLFPYITSVYSLVDYFVIFCYINLSKFDTWMDYKNISPQAYEKYMLLFKQGKRN